MRTPSQPLVIAGLGSTVVTTDAVIVNDAQADLFGRRTANDNTPRIAVAVLRRPRLGRKALGR
jgi:hypothetical protein